MDKANGAAADQKIKIGPSISNLVTGTRVVLAVVVAALQLNALFFMAGTVLVIAALTDGLDGLLARRLKQSSLGGALFDLVADEILFMPNLIIAMITGLFSKANGMMPLNPYLYGVPALAGGTAVLTGVATYLWKRRKRVIEFPTPTGVAKVNFWFWLAPLVIAIFDIGPGWLLAVLMYLAIVSTILTFYSYLKKGGYVFTD